MSRCISVYAKLAFGATFVGILSNSAKAATLYSESFGPMAAASWNVNKASGAGGVNTPLAVSDTTNDANFNFDYSTYGIPAAPHSSDGSTVGLRLRSAISGSVVSGLSVSPTGQSFTGTYTVRADVWGNFVKTGVNATECAAIGVGTTGTKAQWSLNPSGALTFATIRDGGSSNDFRIYNNGSNSATSSGYYLAGTGVANVDSIDTYYSFLPPKTVPAAQVTAFPTQAGAATPSGTISFAWHTLTVAVTTTNVTYAIDGTPIAIVPLSATSFAGSNFLLGSFDVTTGSSTTANSGDQLNFDLFDNVAVVTPEPASLGIIGATGGIALRRRRRA